MKKILLTLALALVLAVQFTAAFATASPTTADLYKVELAKPDGSPAPAGLLIAAIPETETALKVLEDVAETTQGQPVVPSYFADQAEDIAKVLPEGTDAAALKLNELASLVVSGYEADMGDIAARLSFPTLFDATKPVLVLVGLVEGEEVVWEVVQQAGADAEGKVIVLFPSELLLKVQAGNAVIAVLQ